MDIHGGRRICPTVSSTSEIGGDAPECLSIELAPVETATATHVARALRATA
jgi:hypothetical protein